MSDRPSRLARISTMPPFNTRLLPTGSPFTWSVRDRALYVQLLTLILMCVISLAFVAFDGWPFVHAPSARDAVEATTRLAIGVSAAWLVFYLWTWRYYVRRGTTFSWFLAATIVLHILTGTSVCYVLGPFTAWSGFIMIAALLLGMVLLRRHWVWLALAGWFAALIVVHLVSEPGFLPFFPLFEASLAGSDPHDDYTRRIFATALVYVPLVFIMDRLIAVWRQDDQSLHEAAQFDSLTKAFTRRYALSVMRTALEKDRQEESSAAVLMLDLDHFKRVNDTLGHATGDLVLRATTKAVQETLRTGDIVGRFGGEEFVVFLPGADLDQAVGAAERCRAAVESMRLDDVPDLRITVSAGVSAFPGHGQDLDTLIQVADAALYEAKANGRNRVETAGS